MSVLLILGAIATVFAIVGGLVTFVHAVWKLFKFINRVNEALPTLLQVADEFKPNGGSSLHDRIVRLELGQRALLMDRGYADISDFEEPNASRDTRSQGERSEDESRVRQEASSSTEGIDPTTQRRGWSSRKAPRRRGD